MRRVLPLALILLTWLPAETQAVTAKEILELSRAGLTEEVLLALIEVDGGVFTLDTATLKSLKEGGVSERVILAMVRSGRTPAVEPAPQPVVSEPFDQAPVMAPQPQVIVIEHERPVVEHVAVPVYVAVPQGRVFPRGRRQLLVQEPFDPSPGFGAPLPVSPQPVHDNKEPVYWGWGGKLRPDAWKPSNHVEKLSPKPLPPGDKK
jgi:hypothetical protein